MNILRMVKKHLKIHGWPSETIRIGPATCGQTRLSNKSECRTPHAYAEAIECEEFYVFIYDRPCNAHDNARKV